MKLGHDEDLSLGNLLRRAGVGHLMSNPRCLGSIGSPQSASSSQSATNQQVANSGTGNTAIGARATVGGGGSGPVFSIGDKSSKNSLAYTNTGGAPIITLGAKASASYSSNYTYTDNSTDANDALAFDTIDQLETAAANGSAQSLLQAQQGTSGTSATGAPAPTYVVTGGGGDGTSTGGGFSLTPMNAILLAGAALALIYIFKR
jgi:hypothetical protein